MKTSSNLFSEVNIFDTFLIAPSGAKQLDEYELACAHEIDMLLRLPRGKLKTVMIFYNSFVLFVYLSFFEKTKCEKI